MPTDSDLRTLSRLWAEDEGAFRDIYVDGTTADTWQDAVEAITQLDWPSSYSEDGQRVPMPSDAQELLRRGREQSCLWQLNPPGEFRINCHFFDSSWIEFDIDPKEISTLPRLELIYEFLRVVGRALGRPVSVGVESDSGRRYPEDLRFDPTTDAIHVLPDEPVE